MDSHILLMVITAVVIGLGVLEQLRLRRNLSSIRYRIHVNGTRGKSSVVRLIAAGLREGGIRTCAKTTGTLARMIFPDGREVPVYRPRGANVIEQKRIVATAAEHGADALVLECMALQPELQSLCESKFVRATHGVITNARPDHLDVMGPGPADVAKALAGMTPVKARLYTAEVEQLDILKEAALDRGTEFIQIDADAIDAVSERDLAEFPYTEHPANIAIAIAVCEDLGVSRQDALRGMVRATPDPGAMTEHRLQYFGRDMIFVNGFAANDPVSTEQIWRMQLDRYAMKRVIAVFNCRADRADRSMQLGAEFVKWPPPDYVVLMGTGTHIFAPRRDQGWIRSKPNRLR